MPYDEAEQNEITNIFAEMLDACTKDGGRKRAAGEKVDWRIDKSHEGAVFSHITKWKRGEKVDPDSGQHPLQHAAWRLLAIAYQETHPVECHALEEHAFEDNLRDYYNGDLLFPN